MRHAPQSRGCHRGKKNPPSIGAFCSVSEDPQTNGPDNGRDTGAIVRLLRG
ncbi:hypothetical protein ACQY74_000378 (plasmid) [Rhizobium leguminosarum bv. trifolii]